MSSCQLYSLMIVNENWKGLAAQEMLKSEETFRKEQLHNENKEKQNVKAQKVLGDHISATFIGEIILNANIIF